eukprot:c26345_g1_i4 orf=322-1230(+)
MGHESLAGLSPAHRRTQTPTSPSATVFRRQAREDIDLSWMALIRRHQFLLLMLVILTFLCSVYLYFAITLGGDKCSGLSGTQKALCHVKKLKDRGSHGHRATRKLLDIWDPLRFCSIEECSQEYSKYSPCILEHTASSPCRKLGERPLHCRIPVLLKFDKPLFNASIKSVSESIVAVQRTNQLGTEVESNCFLAINITGSNDTEGILDLAASLHSLSSTGQVVRVLIIGCKGGKWAEESIHQNFHTISVTGTGIDDCSVEWPLEGGLLVLQLDFAHWNLPYSANSFDLVLCDVPWHESSVKC